MVATETLSEVTIAEPILTVRDVSRGFARGSGQVRVLADVDLSLRAAEIVGLLGRSGSGKSTLLRIIAGLIRPSGGEVVYRGRPVNGPAEGIAMVFQTFALFPWLTVLQNVEAGLEALSVPTRESRRRALSAIDLIGLDGFESAYPRELSGGMRQRVGFARALVVEPTILLLDEPFSALDVLTAETIRTDLLDLWVERRLPIKSMLLVTHNIEEAVFMCDRILLFSSNPGRVAAEIEVSFPHPRNRLDPAFRQMVDDIYATMTARQTAGAAEQIPKLQIGSRLPPVSTNMIAGLIETVAAPPYDGTISRKLRAPCSSRSTSCFRSPNCSTTSGSQRSRRVTFCSAPPRATLPNSTRSRARRFSPITCLLRCRWRSTSDTCSMSAQATVHRVCASSRSWRII